MIKHKKNELLQTTYIEPNIEHPKTLHHSQQINHYSKKMKQIINKQHMASHSLKERNKRKIGEISSPLTKYKNPFLKYNDSDFIKGDRHRVHKSKAKTLPNLQEQPTSKQKWPVTLNKYIESKTKMSVYLKKYHHSICYFEEQKLDKINLIRQRKRMIQQLGSPKATIIRNQFISNLYYSPSNRNDEARKSSSIQILKKNKKINPKNQKIYTQTLTDSFQESNDMFYREKRDDTLFMNFVSRYFRRKAHRNKWKNFQSKGLINCLQKNEEMINFMTEVDEEN